MSARDSWATIRYRFELTESDGTDFVRVLLRIEQGVVVRFTVQYETVVEGRTYPVIRYDSAHGMPHRDSLDRDGRIVDKLWIGSKTHGEVATDAITAIKSYWREYRQDFLRRAT